MKNKFKFLGALLAVFVILFIAGCGFKTNPPKRYPIKLEVWGLFDNSDAFYGIFDAYRKSNPNVAEINYRKLTPDTYKKELVEALASGQGPDIFLINNTWLPSFKDKIVPATQDILNEQKLRSDFADIVADDFFDQGKIYAVPLSVDSLALYYNRDLFNQAGITEPPANWNEFAEDAQKLTKVNAYGQIVQSGAALGMTSDKINRATDVLNLLFLQNNTRMTDDAGTRATFDQATGRNASGRTISPGAEALSFYTQFAKANSSFYTFNSNMHYSSDAFSEGSLAMMLNYSWQIPVIVNKAPKLNFAIAAVPQLNPSTPVNFPNYWAYAVAKNKTAVTLPNQPAVPDEERVAESWKFLKYLTTRPEIVAGQADKPMAKPFDPAADYIQKTNKPAARKDLIEAQKTDARLGAFAKGNLIAKDWKEVDPDAIEGIFNSMIGSVNRGAASAEDALKTAAAQVTQLMSGR